jgi:putative NADH-flavin reductase
MKVLVLGASGPTGSLFVEQAAAASHHVTAFVRRDAAAPPGAARVVVGDATDAAAMSSAVAGQDAVVSTLGVRTMTPHALQQRAMSVLVPAMERENVRRLVIMSALGVGETAGSAPWFPRLMYALLLRAIFADKAAGEAIVTASSLDWTIVHPPLLTNGPATGKYVAAASPRLTGMPKISRADVARFMLHTLALPEWSRRRVVVTGWLRLD